MHHVSVQVRAGKRVAVCHGSASVTEVNHMTTSIIGLFESNEFAKKVLGELARIGCKKDAMEILHDASSDEVSDRLIEAGYEDDKARSYADALEEGGALIIAETDDDKADDALDTMRRLGALSPERLIERIRNRKAEQETEEAEKEETQSAQVIEEELEIGKAQTTSGKRLKVSVSEQEVQEKVTLLEENVEAERNRVDRVLKPEEADKAFQERTIEMTETREKPVVSKQAHVVEEVVLTKRSGEREVTVSGTVRRQDVTVEDIGDTKAGAKKVRNA
jgi:stress response protein YsnF